MTLTGALTTFGGAIEDGGIGGGTGGALTLASTATGIETLTNANNTYTGATMIKGGTLALSGAGSIADSSGVFLATGGAFDISQTTAGASIKTLGNTAVGQTGTVYLGAQTLTLAGALTTFAGQISDIGGINNVGGGGLTLASTATGTETLSGANNYTGATNINGGTLNVTGSIGVTRATSAVNISQGAALSVSGSVVSSGAVTNAGAVTVSLGGSVTAGLINTGMVTNAGTWIGTGTNNGGTIDNQLGGLWSGAIINTSGTFKNEGTVSGGVSNSAMFTTTGTVNGGLTNASTGTVYAQGTINDGIQNFSSFIPSALTPTGGFTVTGDLSSNGAFTNSGGVAIPQTSTLAVTTFVNGGILDIRAGNSVATTATISGNYSAQNGAQIDLSVNGAATGQQANFLKITGNASGGSTTVAVTALTQTLFTNNIPIISVGGGGTPSSFVAQSNSLNLGNLLTYGVTQQANTYYLFTSLNTQAIGPIAGSIGAAVSAASTSFFQGSTAFIGAPANPAPNQVDGGVWTRGATGMNTDKSVVTTNVFSNPTDLKTDLHFSGYQVGSDLGMFNIQNSGWNLHGGVTAGEYVASASEANFGQSNSSYTVPFLGLYGAVTGHGFYANALVRHDFWNGSILSPNAGLTNAPMTGNGNAATIETGYQWSLPNGFFATPSAGFAYTRATFSPLTLLPTTTTSANVLYLGAVQSDLGRLGLQVGYRMATSDWVVIPSANVSVWHEFAGAIPSVFTNFTPGQNIFSDNISETRIGTFGQFGLSLAAQPLNDPRWTAFVRADYRTGANISGATLTGGFRYQF